MTTAGIHDSQVIIHSVYSVFHSKYLVLTLNIFKAFFEFDRKFLNHFRTLTPAKSTFFFWSLTGFFFPKKNCKTSNQIGVAL